VSIFLSGQFSHRWQRLLQDQRCGTAFNRYLRYLRTSVAPLGLLAFIASGSMNLGMAQTVAHAGNMPDTLGPVVVSPPDRKPVRRGKESQVTSKRAKRTATQTAPKPAPTTQPAFGPEAVSTPPGSATTVVPTPLNGNLVAASASRLGLTVHEMPASVNIVTQQQMGEQGYRTTTETAIGAVGVLAADLGGAPAIFSMRGFKGNEVTVLYNGIWIGPGDITSRIMDTASLA
jgi:iron complex outermembrane recepter protein